MHLVKCRNETLICQKPPWPVPIPRSISSSFSHPNEESLISQKLNVNGSRNSSLACQKPKEFTPLPFIACPIIYMYLFICQLLFLVAKRCHISRQIHLDGSINKIGVEAGLNGKVAMVLLVMPSGIKRRSEIMWKGKKIITGKSLFKRNIVSY